MRFSLAVPLETSYLKKRIRSYEQVEQLALALEIYGWNTIWLQHDSNQDSGQQHILLRSLQLLSNVTDRIDLGLIVQLPAPEEQDRFLEDLKRLDEISSGRVRIAIRPTKSVEASLNFASKLSAVLELDYSAWRARRVQLIAEAEADLVHYLGQASGFGSFVSQNESPNQPILTHYFQTDHQSLSHSLVLELNNQDLPQRIEQFLLHPHLSIVDEAVCQLQSFPADNQALIACIQQVTQGILPRFQQCSLLTSRTYSLLVIKTF